jgi:hypothetical protein
MEVVRVELAPERGQEPGGDAHGPPKQSIIELGMRAVEMRTESRGKVVSVHSSNGFGRTALAHHPSTAGACHAEAVLILRVVTELSPVLR